MKKLLTALFVVAMAFATMHAEAAKRLGGGKSVGQQSSNVTQREAAKPAPAATPTQNAAPAAQPAPAAAPAAAQPSRFGGMGGMLGGLAAGLGLAWLAHSMGFGAEFGQFLMFGLLALAVMMVIGAIMRRRQPEAANSSPYAFEGAGAPVSPNSLPQYNPKNVGNDSSARPVDTHTDFAPVGGGSMIGSALGGNQTWGIPADFDAAGFVSAAKHVPGVEVHLDSAKHQLRPANAPLRPLANPNAISKIARAKLGVISAINLPHQISLSGALGQSANCLSETILDPTQFCKVLAVVD